MWRLEQKVLFSDSVTKKMPQHFIIKTNITITILSSIEYRKEFSLEDYIKLRQYFLALKNSQSSIIARLLEILKKIKYL